MVSSKGSKTISFAISLLVAVISLTGAALAATAPTVSTHARYAPGFAGAPGKMAADAAGNLYVTDFWAKGIVKLDRVGNRIGFVPTAGRPAAVAVKPDGRLVVAMGLPTAYVALYSQAGEELTQFTVPAPALNKPADIAIDAAGNIYVLDSGELTGGTTYKVPSVRVFNPEGTQQLYAFGTKTAPNLLAPITTAGEGQFKVPQGIAYEKASNQIVVADSGNGRLQFFNAFNGTNCTFVKFLGKIAGNNSNGLPSVGTSVFFGDPTDVEFEYNGSALDRVYVLDRARNEISVVDPVAEDTLALIRGASVANGYLKLPSGLVFQKGSVGGVLYAASAPTKTGANIVAFGIDGGTPQGSGVSLAITSSVPPTVTPPAPSTLLLSGTVSPVYPVYCKVNGVGDFLATPSGGDWSVSLGLSDGYNNIVCSAMNGSTALANVETSTFYTPTEETAPVVTINPLPSGVYTKNATVVISGETDVANANVKLTNPNGGATSTTASGADRKWSAEIAVAEGVNLITASAWKPGTATGTANVTVHADFTPPNLASMFSFLANGATTVSAVQNVDGVVIEKNLASIKVNGEVVTATVALPTADNTYYSAPVTLVRDSNTITVEAFDLAGNSAILTRTVTLKPEIPGLTVALPADNSYLTGAGAVPASGTADPAVTSVDACGTAVTPAAGAWSTAAMSVAGGFNSCPFTASGAGIETVSEKRTINAGAAYARLAITSPAADLATKDSSVVLSGTVAIGSATPTISINGGAATPVTSYNSETGLFSHTINLGLDGTTTIVKVMANGATAAVRNIIHDATAPSMAIQANSKIAPSSITGAIEPSAKLSGISAMISGVPTALPISTVTFDSYNQTKPAAVWHADLTGYTYESITFSTVDPAGNQVQRTFVNGIPTGDVDRDGAVRLSDAMACLRHVAGTQTLSGSEVDKDSPRFQADVGSLIEERAAQDGTVTVEDAQLILLKAYGLKSF